MCCELCLLTHILHYNVHKLSKYKKQFVYIIKEVIFKNLTQIGFPWGFVGNCRVMCKVFLKNRFMSKL